MLIDTAEGELVKLIKAGNPQAVFFCLRTVGHVRGWREGLRLERPASEPPRQTSEETTRRLRQLSREELEALEKLVLKMEGKTSIHDGIAPPDDYVEADDLGEG